MKRRTAALALSLWLTVGLLTSGFMNAYLQHYFDFIGDKKCHSYRDDLAFSVGWSLALGPIGTLMSPFLTGFYQHGWRLSPRQDCGISDPQKHS